MPYLLTFGRDTRVNLLLGSGHFLSHFYQLCLPPVFIAWQQAFDVSFAELGLVMAVMSATSALLQTPMGFLVDRYGARPFLVAGTLLMTSSIGAMGFATTYWQIVVLALLSGVGNSVFHPADYAILSGSIDPGRLGRSFAFHTFTGNIGFAAAPPATAALMLLLGWRGALILVGLLGLPVLAAIVWQSRILVDQARRPPNRAAERGAGLLLSRSVLMFFAFFMVTAMAGAGIQSWLITILHQVHGLPLATASSALTGYMVGHPTTDEHAAAVLLLVGVVSLPEPATIGVLFVGGLMTGARNTPRDVMVKDAAPPGQIGKVFGFVSSGMSLGGAIMPVPYGMIIDAGHPELVLVVVAALLLLSLLFAGGARVGFRRAPVPVAAE